MAQAKDYESGEVVKSIYRKEGHKDGKAEGKAEVALNLIAGGFDNETVSKFTGLSMEEVNALRNQK